MSRFIILLVISSMAALAAPSVFEKYKAQMMASQTEAIDPPATIVEASTGPANPVASGSIVRLDADATGHFRTDARANGRRLNVLVDTGATLVAFDEATARSLGIAPGAADFRYKVSTANGEAPAARVTIARLQLGPIVVNDVDAIVTKDGTLPTALLGMSFLNRLSKFEISDGRLTLRQ